MANTFRTLRTNFIRIRRGL